MKTKQGLKGIHSCEYIYIVNIWSNKKDSRYKQGKQILG